MTQNENAGKARYVDLLIDDGFKRVFGEPSSKDLMIALITSILPQLKIKDITYLNKEKNGLWEDAKKSVFDVLCQTESGTEVIVEVQLNPQSYFRDRTVYYVAQELLTQHTEGDEDYTLSPIYVISFLNFKLSHEVISDQVTWNYSLREDSNGELMTDAIHFTYIELPKFKKQVQDLVNLQESFYFCMKHLATLKERPENLQSEILQRLFEKAEIAKMAPREQIRYKNAMNTERDIRNQIRYAEEQAAAKAAKKAKIAAKIAAAQASTSKSVEIAQKMKERQLPIADIVACTGLSEAEIAGL